MAANVIKESLIGGAFSSFLGKIYGDDAMEQDIASKTFNMAVSTSLAKSLSSAADSATTVPIAIVMHAISNHDVNNNSKIFKANLKQLAVETAISGVMYYFGFTPSTIIATQTALSMIFSDMDQNSPYIN